MSSVYSGGVHATAITAIKAAINARISTLPDGTKDLDRESLSAWLRTQFDSMITDAESTSVSYIAGIDVAALVANLNAVIGRSVIASRPDFPSATAVMSDSSIVASLRENLAALDALSADVTTFYKDTPQKIIDIVGTYLEANVISKIPPGVTRLVESSAIIATYVTDWGEESAPSPVSLLFDRDQNDSFSVVVPAPPGGRHVTHFRLYMAASTSNSASYFLIPNPADVDGWPIGTLTVTPLSLSDATVGIKDAELQEPCPTTTWEEPPADLRGLVGMANGMNVGFTGNTIVPCEPYKPYAFPPEYRKTTSHPIVGLCALDQLLVVGTMGPPKILAGADAASLTEIHNNSGQACVSARSMVAIGGGVMYASPDGLCMADATGAVRLVTGAPPQGYGLFAREDWQALTPASIFAAELEGCYVFHVPAGFCYSFNPSTGKLTKLAIDGSAFYRDELTDTLYLASGTAITALFSGVTYRSGLWRTKRVVLPRPVDFRWLQVNSDFGANVTIRLYRNGALHQTLTVASRVPVGVSPGKGEEWEVEIQSAVRVTGVTVASTTAELNEV